MNVTPEMIEAGAKAMYGHGDEGKWADCPNKDFWRGYAEEALTAALSSPIGRDIRNSALEEAAIYVEQRNGSIPDRQEIAAGIRALASDGKRGGE